MSVSSNQKHDHNVGHLTRNTIALILLSQFVKMSGKQVSWLRIRQRGHS